MRVLIINDDLFILEMLKEIVKTLEIKVVDTAMNGHDGFLKVLKQQYDFVICDLNMPVVDGYECAEKIKNHYYSPTIFADYDKSLFQPFLIACSAFIDEDIENRCKLYGFEMVYQILTVQILNE